VKLGDVCGVGSSKRVFVDEFVAEGVPFYRGTEVGKLATREVIQPKLFIAPGHYEDLIAHSGKPEIGDLLLPSICHDGRIWQVDSEEPFYFKDGRVLWIKKNESVLDSEYLRNHLRNAFLRNYSSIASGTTFAELKIVNLSALPILRPPLRLQAEFSRRIREVGVCRLSFVRSEMMAESLFVSLQHRAFNGELMRARDRVSEPA
jgi:type I restriction enzyme S subunit